MMNKDGSFVIGLFLGHNNNYSFMDIVDWVGMVISRYDEIIIGSDSM